jgi:hypothetical protein
MSPTGAAAAICVENAAVAGAAVVRAASVSAARSAAGPAGGLHEVVVHPARGRPLEDRSQPLGGGHVAAAGRSQPAVALQTAQAPAGRLARHRQFRHQAGERVAVFAQRIAGRRRVPPHVERDQRPQNVAGEEPVPRVEHAQMVPRHQD